MSNKAPYRLSIEDVERAGLEPSDVGMWCIIVAGCYHLFETERGAKRAYRLMLDGVMVR